MLTPSLDWLLHNLQLTTSVFHVGRYCERWQATTGGLRRSSFHLVVQGSCWLHVEGHDACRMDTGDAIFLLRDLPHVLSPEADIRAYPGLVSTSMVPLEMKATDGAGLVCGFFEFEEGLTHLIIDSLPDVILLRAQEPTQRGARALLELIIDECEQSTLPPLPLLERLIQLLFIYLLRHHINTNEQLTGLVGLARSSQLSGLLEKIVERPERAWTVEMMAEEVGLSRSAFFKRFSEMCNYSPAQVVLSLRMRKATELLKMNQSVSQVCEAVGYQSVAAFTRAFQKATGILPGAYRRQQVSS